LWLVAATALALVGCGDAGPHENVGQSSSAITFPNDQPAFDYFVGKGLTKFQAAGIVGNLDQESGVDPTAVQAGGPGRGIAQWSVGGRWDTDAMDNATWYASQQGQTLLSLQLQLDFIWYELTTFPSYGLAALQAATNVTDATIAFQNDFEGCGQCDQTTRVSYAETVLAAFGSSDATVPVVADAGGYGTCVVPATNEMGDCIDTAACAAGGGTSTPNECPGPSNIQCCTGLPVATLHDAGASAHADGGASGGSKPDAGVSATGSGSGSGSSAGSGTGRSVGDAAAPREGGDLGAFPGNPGGCAAAPVGSAGSRGALWLAAFATILAARRKRASSRSGHRVGHA